MIYAAGIAAYVPVLKITPLQRDRDQIYVGQADSCAPVIVRAQSHNFLIRKVQKL